MPTIVTCPSLPALSIGPRRADRVRSVGAKDAFRSGIGLQRVLGQAHRLLENVVVGLLEDDLDVRMLRHRVLEALDPRRMVGRRQAAREDADLARLADLLGQELAEVGAVLRVALVSDEIEVVRADRCRRS